MYHGYVESVSEHPSQLRHTIVSLLFGHLTRPAHKPQ